MRAFFLLIIGLAALTPFPAHAADMLQKFREHDPAAALLEKNAVKPPQTVADYANMFYDGCTSANENESLRDYTATQCACTAAQMTGFMALNDMQALFRSNTGEGEFQYGRMMLLAYIPCMKTSVYDIAFDACYFGKPSSGKIQPPRKICACVATGMGQFAAEKGDRLLPGFFRNSFRIKQSAANPLGHLLASDAFKRESDYLARKCSLEAAQ